MPSFSKGKPRERNEISFSDQSGDVTNFTKYTGILQNSCSNNFGKQPGTYPWRSTMLVKLQTFPQFYWSRTLQWMFSWIFSKYLEQMWLASRNSQSGKLATCWLIAIWSTSNSLARDSPFIGLQFSNTLGKLERLDFSKEVFFWRGQFDVIVIMSK